MIPVYNAYRLKVQSDEIFIPDKIEDSYNGERNFKFYSRSYALFLPLKPVKTVPAPRLFVAFQLVHLENAINPASPRQQISMIPTVNFGETWRRFHILSLSLSRGISLGAKL